MEDPGRRAKLECVMTNQSCEPFIIRQVSHMVSKDFMRLVFSCCLIVVVLSQTSGLNITRLLASYKFQTAKTPIRKLQVDLTCFSLSFFLSQEFIPSKLGGCCFPFCECQHLTSPHHIVCTFSPIPRFKYHSLSVSHYHLCLVGIVHQNLFHQPRGCHSWFIYSDCKSQLYC